MDDYDFQIINYDNSWILTDLKNASLTQNGLQLQPNDIHSCGTKILELKYPLNCDLLGEYSN